MRRSIILIWIVVFTSHIFLPSINSKASNNNLWALSNISSGLLVSTRQMPLSPRKSSEYTLNGKRINIEYGSPSIRGREIWGKLVPYNVVWGVGANKATIFRTESDIMINGMLIPAGSYTLFTLPTDTMWYLIFNKRLDLWCKTPYDDEVKSTEFVRIKMRKSILSNPVEQLKFDFVQSNPGVIMKIAWERVVVEVTIIAKSDHNR